jgi:hypothetical protein
VCSLSEDDPTPTTSEYPRGTTNDKTRPQRRSKSKREKA